MIKNDRQYRILRAEAEAFRSNIEKLKRQQDADPLHHAKILSLVGQYEELMSELSEYEMLRFGQRLDFRVTSLDELPIALIRARIASGLTQKDLAERLGLSEQQIQRYESTEYASASMSRVLEVARTLGIQIDSRLEIDPKAVQMLRGVGRSSSQRKLMNDRLGIQDQDCGDLSLETTRKVHRVFATQMQEGMAVAFKRLRTSPKSQPYVVYTRYLSMLLLKAVEYELFAELPKSPRDVISAIAKSGADISFSSVLKYVWDLGIPVLPLSDSGIFHGACWRMDGRNVIVLKQKTKSPSRWLFDLLHELYHAITETHASERSVIESGDLILCSTGSREEFEANRFAGEVVLHGRAEELAQLCVKRAGGHVERLKSVVLEVSHEQGVDIGSLANYMAFRLSLQGINWWGAASNLQSEGSPFEIARDELLRRIDLTRLDATDRDLLMRAIDYEAEG